MPGLREYFSQTDERNAPPRVPVMVNMTSASLSSKKGQKLQDSSLHPTPSLDQLNNPSRNSVMMEDYTDEDEEFQIAEAEQEVSIKVLSCMFFLFITKDNVFRFMFPVKLTPPSSLFLRHMHPGLRMTSEEQVEIWPPIY